MAFVELMQSQYRAARTPFVVRAVIVAVLSAATIAHFARSGAAWAVFGMVVSVIGATGVMTARFRRAGDDPVRMSTLSIVSQALLVAALFVSAFLVETLATRQSPGGLSVWVVAVPIALTLFADVWLIPLRRLVGH